MCEETTNGKNIKIENEDLTPATIIRLNLSDLAEDACFELKDAPEEYCVVHCEPAHRRGQICPGCQSQQITVHGSLGQDRLVHDVSVGIKQVDLLVKVPRYRCNRCSTTFTHRFESIMENRQMTRRLYDQIKRETFVSTFSDIADKYGITPPTVAGIFDEYVAELEPLRKRIVAPRVLGIDEKHIVKSARGVFVDIEEGTLLEMVAGNKRNDIISAIEAMEDYDKNIQIVTMDMAAGYRTYVQECLPNAKIIVDKFHVFQLLSSKVVSSRSKIIRYLSNYLKTVPNGPQKQTMQMLFNAASKDSFLFKFSTEKVLEDQQRLGLMAQLCSYFPEFNHLRMLKEGFERIYLSFDREDAEEAYRAWLPLVPPSGAKQQEKWRKEYSVDPELYSDFKVLANTLKNWHEEIFGYFDPGCGFTNATTEGLNNLVERFNRLGNGYSFERLRAKALYFHLAAPKVRYTLKTKVLPNKNQGIDLRKMGYASGPLELDFSKGKTERYIVEEADVQQPRKPLSVLSYVNRPVK